MRWRSSLAVILWIPCATLADVTFDASSGVKDLNFTTSKTFSFTTAGDNRALIFEGFMQPTYSISNVAYNGTNLNKTLNGINGYGHNVYLWTLQNPDVGAHNVVITISDYHWGSQSVVASFNGVNQGATFIRDSGTYTGNTADPSITLTTLAGDMAVDALANGSGDLPQTAGQTQLISVDASALHAEGGYVAATGTSKVMTYHRGSSANMCYLALALMKVVTFSPKMKEYDAPGFHFRRDGPAGIK